MRVIVSLQDAALHLKLELAPYPGSPVCAGVCVLSVHPPSGG